MEHTVGVDKQGRIVIPTSIRQALGLAGAGKAFIRLNGDKIIIELMMKTLIKGWRKLALNVHAQAFIEKSENSWKWMSREYAERKLGIR